MGRIKYLDFGMLLLLQFLFGRGIFHRAKATHHQFSG